MATCRRCGRTFSAPLGRLRAMCVPQQAPVAREAAPVYGPGTELKSLLAAFGIIASPTCKCNKMARQMDVWGPDASLSHMEEIVDVMEETAKARKLPFLRIAARQMIRLACWKARRKARQGH
jgi:hypothetical protein